MMHRYVVGVIAVRRYPEERTEYPINVLLEERGPPPEQWPMSDVVVHGKDRDIEKSDHHKQISASRPPGKVWLHDQQDGCRNDRH
jgi:hypothetical protein